MPYKIPVDKTNPQILERSPKHESSGYSGVSSEPSQMSSAYIVDASSAVASAIHQNLPVKQFVNYFTAHNKLLQSKLLQIHEQEFKEIIFSIIQNLDNEVAALTCSCSNLCLWRKTGKEFFLGLSQIE